MLSENQKRFVELERKKAEIKKFNQDLQDAVKALVDEIGVGGHFQDEEGVVYQIVEPKGTFVSFEKYGYERTRRNDEKAGSLSIVKAVQLGYNLKEKQ
jgi:hypothetical protein